MAVQWNYYRLWSMMRGVCSCPLANSKAVYNFGIKLMIKQFTNSWNQQLQRSWNETNCMRVGHVTSHHYYLCRRRLCFHFGLSVCLSDNWKSGNGFWRNFLEGMAQGPMSSILVTIQITVRIQESEVRNADSLDYRKSTSKHHIKAA